MSTLSRIRASLFNKTESPPPSIRSTFHQAIQAGDYRKVQKLLDDPQNRADAIHVFASTAWSNFPYQHTKPGEHQDFLRCGLRIALMALEDTDMGAQAWAAWTTPQHASDPMPAQKVAQLEGHQNEFARALGEAMRKLGRQHHPWVAEQDLPPEQQFLAIRNIVWNENPLLVVSVVRKRQDVPLLYAQGARGRGRRYTVQKTLQLLNDGQGIAFALQHPQARLDAAKGALIRGGTGD